MMNKDLIEINVQNSYGDELTAKMINPTCEDVVQKVVKALKVLGFSDAAIYFAMGDQSDKLKTKILN